MVRKNDGFLGSGNLLRWSTAQRESRVHGQVSTMVDFEIWPLGLEQIMYK